MDFVFTTSVFFVVWWTVLFAVLPLGTRTYAEEGIKVTDGGDPGAPVNPNLKRKFITTTWISAVVTAVIWVVVTFHLVKLGG